MRTAPGPICTSVPKHSMRLRPYSQAVKSKFAAKLKCIHLRHRAPQRTRDLPETCAEFGASREIAAYG